MHDSFPEGNHKYVHIYIYKIVWNNHILQNNDKQCLSFEENIKKAGQY